MAQTKRKQTNPNLVTSTTTINFTEPRSKSRTPKPSSIVVIAPNNLLGGFINFLKDHAIVGVAVGFAIATQVQTVVKQLVDSFITPTFQFFFKGDLVQDRIIWHFRSRVIVYNWGQFANDLLDLIFVLAVLYLIIRIFQLDRLNTTTTTTTKSSK